MRNYGTGRFVIILGTEKGTLLFLLTNVDISLALQLLLSEKDLIVREEACRTGLLFGGFTGAFHAIRCLLRRTRNKETPING
jgi:hypothetical protein